MKQQHSGRPPSATNFLTPPAGNSPKALLQQAMAMYQRGQLTQAEKLLRDVLARDARQFDALQMLALLRLQRKDHAEGLALLDRAIAQRSELAPLHNNRGIALRSLGRLDDALASYDRAVVLQPDYADAINNRGNVLRDLGRAAEALQAFDRVLALKPAHAQAHNNRGAVLRDLGRSEEALEAFEQALTFKPDYAEALNNRGGAQQDLKRYAQAHASYSRAIEVQPDYADAFNNRGGLLEQLHRYDDALADYERAIALLPDFAMALGNRGNVLSELRRNDEALASYGLALSLQPESPGMLANRAGALSQLKRHDEASADYERLLHLAPDHPYARGNLLMSRLHSCDWTDYDETLQRVEAETLACRPAALPFTLAVASARPDVQLAGATTYTEREAAASTTPKWHGERYQHDRIRLAYVSADFHDHATAHLMIDLFEQHDRARFELTAISMGPEAPSVMRERLRAAFDHFIDARHLGDDDVARLIREREIDIAVDLKGHTRDSRPGIFALRPAPVQVNYLGYPGTMGAPFIDYIIADRNVITDEDRALYTEQIVRLPGSYQVNSVRPASEAPTPTRDEAGLPQGAFVFCSFNNNYKITPRVFACWMNLLNVVEGSVLWLLEDNPIAVRNLRAAASGLEVDAERLVFAPRARLQDHLARHRLADLFLDTIPCNAHTTASDALWAGLPLLTCRGSSFAGRVAASLLQSAGLHELVAENLDDYRDKAIALAREAGRLADIRARLLAHRDAPPFDMSYSRMHLEAAYRSMWQASLRGESPAAFDVDARNS